MDGSRSEAEIDVSHLSYGVHVKGKLKLLVKDVTFHINKGDLCALMGPSGAGKSTLLDLLANRKQEGVWCGDILVNQIARTAFFHRDSAYVLQDDLHLPTLTVRETLSYAAWVKLPEGTSETVRNERVVFLLSMMGLEHVQDSPVGDALQKGISGGQMKRLSIAVEIVSLPSLIFFDEPTSGLDSSIALEVMGSVRRLADQHRTCLCTIHSPSPEVFSLFDTVILLDQGSIVYAGPRSQVVEHFTSPPLGFTLDPDSNPAEFILDVCAGGNISSSSSSSTTNVINGAQKKSHVLSTAQLKDLYDRSEFCAVMSDKVSLAMSSYREAKLVQKSAESQGGGMFFKAVSGHTRTHATSNWTQIRMLMSRSFLAQARDTAALKTAIFKSVFVGLIIGCVFFDLANPSPPFYTVDAASGEALLTPGVQNLASAFFFFVMYCLMNNLEQIPAICLNQNLYRRELASYSYSAAPYWLVNCLYPLPLCLVTHIIWFVMSFYMCGFQQKFHYFMYFFWITFWTTVAAFYYAQGMAAGTQSAEVSFALFPMTFVFLTQFCGYSISIKNIPPGWEWASLISFPRWTFEGLMINDFGIRGEEGDEVLEQYGFDDFEKWNSMWIIFFSTGICALTSYYFLRKPVSKLIHSSDFLTECEDGFDVAAHTNVNTSKVSSDVGSQDWIVLGDEEGGEVTTHVDDGGIDTRPLLDAQSSSMQQLSTMPTSNGCNVSFSNVEYRVTSRHTQSELHVLKGVSGYAVPGEICALMGASGAGKTTLLDLVSNRKTTGHMKGDILFDGAPRSADIARRSAYVMQDNVHLPMLTVRQTLKYASLLRMQENISGQQKEARVNQLISMLGLLEHADTLVGDARVRGISGGQAKRLSIGVEIINLPDLLFFDEPTTGLDSSISLEVIGAIRILANQNRTIVATIHQPSTALYAMFDKLLLMAEGEVIYYGPATQAVPFFVSSPYAFHYTRGTNPAEFVIAVAGSLLKHTPTSQNANLNSAPSASAASGEVIVGTGAPEGACSVKEMVAHYHSSTFFAELCKHVDCTLTKNAEFTPVSSGQAAVYNTSTLYQIRVLSQRDLINKVKDPYATVTDLMMHLMVSLFYGSIYYQLDNTQYQERLCVIFFSLIFMIMGHQKQMPVIFRERLLFYRERSAGAYGPLAYWVTSIAVSLPFVMLNVFIYGISVHQLVGLRNDPGNFLDFYVILVLVSLTGMFACRAVAALASSEQAAITLFPALIQFLMAFSGFGIFLPVMQTWLAVWAPYITFVRWGFQALMLNEFEGNTDMALSEVYIEDLGFDDYSELTCGYIVPIFLAFFAILQLTALKYISFEER